MRRNKISAFIIAIIQSIHITDASAGGATPLDWETIVPGRGMGQDVLVTDLVPPGCENPQSIGAWPPFKQRSLVMQPGTQEAVVANPNLGGIMGEMIRFINAIHSAMNRRGFNEAQRYANMLSSILGGSRVLTRVELPASQIEQYRQIRQWGIEAITHVKRIAGGSITRGDPEMQGAGMFRPAPQQPPAPPSAASSIRPAAPTYRWQAGTGMPSIPRAQPPRMNVRPQSKQTRRPPTTASALRARGINVPRAIPRTPRAVPMTSVRTRSVVAIAAAIPVVPIISPEDELVNRRINGAIFELSAFILGTPAFSQAVLYRMLMDGEATIPNQEIVLPKIKEQWDLLLSVTSDLQQRYPEEAEIISGTVRAKWVNYTSYLRYVHEWLDHTPMALFTAVDRGQTSEGNRNTCMFNSIFSADLRLRNITSTKRNIIERARAYIAQLRAYYIPAYMETADDPLINDEDGIDEHLIRLDADRSADEEYGAGAEGALGRMVPGQIADCSAAEAQAHALGLNIMIFPKQKTGTGDTLASYFGTGYLGSEHFPVSAVSCSLWHAQSLIPRTVPA